MRSARKIFLIGLLMLLAMGLIILATNFFVENITRNKLYDSTSKIPHNKVGVLLGTSKFLTNGSINLYYKFRIDAAVELFNSGKINFILVSGDNSSLNYDEPSTIKNDLVNEGIPANRIYLDYAGFRTLDSMIRSKKVFGQSSITVISQKFHNERAIYIAQRKGVEAIGFNAKDVNVSYGFKTKIREKLARVKMVMDLLFGKEPKFLGKAVEIK